MAETQVKESILVNGQSEVLAARTIAQLLAEKGIDAGGRGLAVALNGAVVPRSSWSDTALQPGDAVEIVQAKQGG